MCKTAEYTLRGVFLNFNKHLTGQWPIAERRGYGQILDDFVHSKETFFVVMFTWVWPMDLAERLDIAIPILREGGNILWPKIWHLLLAYKKSEKNAEKKHKWAIMDKTFYIRKKYRHKKWEKYVPINKRKRESAN